MKKLVSVVSFYGVSYNLLLNVYRGYEELILVSVRLFALRVALVIFPSLLFVLHQVSRFCWCLSGYLCFSFGLRQVLLLILCLTGLFLKLRLQEVLPFLIRTYKNKTKKLPPHWTPTNHK